MTEAEPSGKSGGRRGGRHAARNMRRDNFKHYYRFRAAPSHCRPRASRVINAARVTGNQRPKVAVDAVTLNVRTELARGRRPRSSGARRRCRRCPGPMRARAQIARAKATSAYDVGCLGWWRKTPRSNKTATTPAATSNQLKPINELTRRSQARCPRRCPRVDASSPKSQCSASSPSSRSSRSAPLSAQLAGCPPADRASTSPMR